MTAGVDYVQIVEGELLPDVSAFKPFRAVVIIGAPYSSDWQNMVSKWLVDSGCLYMMAWGEGCSSWDDSVDWANLEEFDYGEVPDERFVMTTWHDNEPLEEVMGFAHYAADAYDDAIELRQTLIIDISTEDRSVEMLDRFAAAVKDWGLKDWGFRSPETGSE